MADATSILSLGVSVVALGIALRADRRSARDHAQRQEDRAAQPALGIDIQPSNVKPDDRGVIRTEATAVYVNLAITITNDGSKPAERTQVEVWVPSFVDSPTLKWMDPSGAEQDRFGTSAPDPATQLDTGDGRLFETQRMTRTLEAVPLIGETVYLRLNCPVPVQGESMVPVRVRARTHGSEADVTYPIRLQNTKQAF
jgi:hypothetical protein